VYSNVIQTCWSVHSPDKRLTAAEHSGTNACTKAQKPNSWTEAEKLTAVSCTQNKDLLYSIKVGRKSCIWTAASHKCSMHARLMLQECVFFHGLIGVFWSLEPDMRLTCPAQCSCDAVMRGSALGVLALFSTLISGTLSCQWIPRIWRRCRSWVLVLAQRTKGFGGSLNLTLYFQIWWIVACNCATEIDEILSCGECWFIHQLSYYHTF